MDSLKELLPSIVFCIGAAIAITILMRRIRRSSDDAADRRSRRFQANPKDEGGQNNESPDLLRWQVELHEISRDMRAEIDSKMRALQSLTALANQAAERLEAAIKADRDRSIRDTKRN